jgi:hypothetical protein
MTGKTCLVSVVPVLVQAGKKCYWLDSSLSPIERGLAPVMGMGIRKVLLAGVMPALLSPRIVIR